ncbi:MAG: hypothetical protein QNJ87_13350 [Gammaproteobacteria bacterium]|nr:hypothetical protein [Gammaproteobacteria bacterium]
MVRSIKAILILLFALSPAVHAQEVFLQSLQDETDRYQWRQVGADMSPALYGEALRHNRRLARDTLADTIVSAGVPKMGVSLVGAAVALAVDDLKVPLNSSKTLALKIDDATEEGRSAVLQVKFKW